MKLSNFDDFLSISRLQPEAHRLLFVFAGAELPQGHTPGQEQRFREGRGGALAPLMCVDKSPAELTGFAALAEESKQTGECWDIMLVAALAAGDGGEPFPADIERTLRTMIGSVQRGAVDKFLAFDAAGDAIVLS